MQPEFLTDALLSPFRHGFFTRRGGVSRGIHAELNCGTGSADRAGDVAENRARVAAALGVASDSLATLHQVHSAEVVVVGEPPAPPRPRADAMVTATPGIALGILTADCQPVLFAEPEAGVVGAAHAGWKGALAGVLDATVEAMEGLGARRDRIRAVIGPAIGPDAYEVGPEFRDRFVADDPGNARFFRPGAGDRLLFDLPGYGLARLRLAGIAAARWTGHCTFSDPERFFSYRRAMRNGEPDYGRLISAIAVDHA